MEEEFLIWSSNVLADTEKGLTGAEIIKHCCYYSTRFNVNIPIKETTFPGKCKKSDVLKLNLQSFEDRHKFIIINELCDLAKFKDKDDVKEVKKVLIERYSYLEKGRLEETELVKETKHWLDNYPEALKVYDEALLKYEQQKFPRNVLDDMRVALELLLKKLLNNDKSLENQLPLIQKKLEEKNISKELRNTNHKLLKLYTDYQNHNVKHNDNVNKDEIEYVIELTSIFMKFLIKNLS